MKAALKILLHVLIIGLLTCLTQIGGVVYISVTILAKRLGWNWKKTALYMISSYLIMTFLLVPVIAPMFGRVHLPLYGNMKPLSYVTPLMNRHYVKRELKEELELVGSEVAKKFEGRKINYLDANFPFLDGFRLLPHLSHNDGKKIDLAFLYLRNDEISNTAPSYFGYGVFVGPEKGESNSTQTCLNKGYWQYDMTKYLGFSRKGDFELDEEATRYLIKQLTKKSGSKVLLEPHLKSQLRLSNDLRVRFHGCHAVRHDDHIHFQIP